MKILIKCITPNWNTEYHNEEGLLHREDGPAVIWDAGLKEWLLNGKLHRLNGPAREDPSGYKEYWVNDKRVFK